MGEQVNDNEVKGIVTCPICNVVSCTILPDASVYLLAVFVTSLRVIQIGITAFERAVLT